MSGFFNVPQSYLRTRVVRRDLRFIVLSYLKTLSGGHDLPHGCTLSCNKNLFFPDQCQLCVRRWREFFVDSISALPLVFPVEWNNQHKITLLTCYHSQVNYKGAKRRHHRPPPFLSHALRSSSSSIFVFALYPPLGSLLTGQQ